MKFKSGGIIKLQNAGVLPRGMQKLNSGSMPEGDESAGERIFNSTIKAANNASTQEERDKIYLDSAKRNLAVTGQSLMMIPVLNEFAINGLIKGGLRLAGGTTASAGGSGLGGKAGNGLNSKLNTTKLDDAGRIIGGIAAFPIGMKAMTKVPVEFGTKMGGQLHNNNIKRQLLNSTYEPFNIELGGDRFNHGLQKTIGRMRPKSLDYTLGCEYREKFGKIKIYFYLGWKFRSLTCLK